MDDRVRTLKTPAECETFEANAKALGRNDLAVQARQRRVELRADVYGAKTEAERECVQAIYAYEEILFRKHGKRVSATRTWQMIDRHGIIGAVERAVDRPDGTAGFAALKEIGLDNFAFEAVVMRYPDLFSERAVTRSRERMASLGA
jgi:hypothetical protein